MLRRTCRGPGRANHWSRSPCIRLIVSGCPTKSKSYPTLVVFPAWLAASRGSSGGTAGSVLSPTPASPNCTPGLQDGANEPASPARALGPPQPPPSSFQRARPASVHPSAKSCSWSRNQHQLRVHSSDALAHPGDELVRNAPGPSLLRVAPRGPASHAFPLERPVPSMAANPANGRWVSFNMPRFFRRQRFSYGQHRRDGRAADTGSHVVALAQTLH